MFFSNKLKVGVLCPASATYPNLSLDYMNGLMCGLPENLHQEFEFLPEFVNQGETNRVNSALRKLYGFNGVDLVTGPISYNTLPDYADVVEASGKLAIFTDLGEYLPALNMVSPYVFNNSFQYWQAQFAMGFWAQQQFGDRGAVVMALYESGYHMHSAFRHGTEFGGSEVVDYVVIPKEIEGERAFADYTEQLQNHFIQNERPSYINLLFSGKDAVRSLKAFAANPYFDGIPILVSPHMSSPEILQLLTGENVVVYSANLWDFDSAEKENAIFRKKYIQRTGNMANVFSLLGYEVGLAIACIYPSLRSKSYAEARKFLAEERIKSPRGERSFFLDSKYASPQIDIEKINLAGLSVQRVIVAQGKAMPYNCDVYRQIHEECVTGWKNPYLCV
ncbi:MAG: ABC transporter substrate-binding protein [Balneolales bacterium]|nr:ABC transporter substrate-binding protein [Balneolales bacterium]